LVAENTLLQGLITFGTEAMENAYYRIPRTLRTMFVHAYQSWVWNLAASERVKLGLKPIPGDLSLVRSKAANLKRAVGDDVIRDDEEEFEIFEKEERPVISVVTKETIGLYRIEDVVLPLPGYEVMFPVNDVGKFMISLMARDKLSPTSFNHRLRDVRAKGAYRYLIEKPGNFKWRLTNYSASESETPLILSDHDKMTGKTLQQKCAPNCEKKLALCVEFDLPSAAYATMLFREFAEDSKSAMKIDENKSGE
jgi:tRNA pseudouridine13 synthase